MITPCYYDCDMIRCDPRERAPPAKDVLTVVAVTSGIEAVHAHSNYTWQNKGA